MKILIYSYIIVTLSVVFSCDIKKENADTATAELKVHVLTLKHEIARVQVVGPGSGRRK
jgi:hypothetical protein